MFHVVSNPFVEMAQGAVSNGLGYIAQNGVEYMMQKKKKNWTWWLLLPLSIIFVITYNLGKKCRGKSFKKILEEIKQKFL